MTTTAGDRFVRRHDAARTTTSNTTAADITYDTAVLSDGDGYTYNGPDVEVDTAGLYLCVFDIGQADLASTRAVGTLVPRLNGTTDQARFRASHRYLRNSGGAEGASIGMAILDLAATDDVRARNPGVLTPTDALGSYATRVNHGGGLQLLRLPANDLTHVERTVDAAEVGTSNINATRPWVAASGTWTKITYNSEVVDDAGLYPGSGGDLTLAANTKYLVVWGATCYSTDASRHTYIAGLNIDGDRVQTASGYQRNTASQGPPMCGMYAHETGGSAETVFLEATHEIEGGDAGTPNVSDAYLQVIELPSSAEWIHVDNSTTDSLTTALAGTGTYYDTPLSATFRADGGSDLSLDSGNDAVQNDSGATLPVLAIGWHRWDRDGGASGTRKMPWSRWDNGGSAVGYGIAGAYSRGQQATDDTWQAHYCSAVLLDLANAADLSFQVNEPASAANSDMGIYASASRYFLGVQVLNLDSLTASGPSISSVDSPIYGDTSDELDINEDIDINGSNFAATGNTVYLADAATVAASAREVDVSAAIGTEGTTEITVDLDSLGATPKADLETLIATDGHSLFVIVDDGSAETSRAVTVHRALAFTLSASPNIATGGTDTTTARLTAPAGKTTGDFDAGRRSDDTSPVPSFTIDADDYSELEDALEATTDAVDGETYEFRIVRDDGTPLDTYTVTPLWTIGAGATQMVASFSAELSAASNATRTAVLAASLAAELTVTSTAFRTVPIAAALAGELTTTASAARVVQITAALAAELTTTSDAARVAQLSASLASELTTTATAARVVALAASLAAELSATADASRIASLTAALSAELTSTSTAFRSIPLAASLAAELTTTADASRTVPVAASLAAELTSTSDATRTVQLSASFAAEATSTVDATRTAQLTGSFSSELTTTATATKTVGITAALASELTTTAAADRTVQLAASLASELTTTSAASVGTPPTQMLASFAAELTATSSASRTAAIAAALTAELTTTTDAARIAQLAASLASELSSTSAATVGTPPTQMAASFTAELSTTSTADRLAQLAASLSAELTASSTATRTAVIAAALASELTTTSAGTVGTPPTQMTASLAAGLTTTADSSRTASLAASLAAGLSATSNAVRVAQIAAVWASELTTSANAAVLTPPTQMAAAFAAELTAMSSADRIVGLSTALVAELSTTADATRTVLLAGVLTAELTTSSSASALAAFVLPVTESVIDLRTANRVTRFANAHQVIDLRTATAILVP